MNFRIRIRLETRNTLWTHNSHCEYRFRKHIQAFPERRTLKT